MLFCLWLVFGVSKTACQDCLAFRDRFCCIIIFIIIRNSILTGNFLSFLLFFFLFGSNVRLHLQNTSELKRLCTDWHQPERYLRANLKRGRGLRVRRRKGADQSGENMTVWWWRACRHLPELYTDPVVPYLCAGARVRARVFTCVLTMGASSNDKADSFTSSPPSKYEMFLKISTHALIFKSDFAFGQRRHGLCRKSTLYFWSSLLLAYLKPRIHFLVVGEMKTCCRCSKQKCPMQSFGGALQAPVRSVRRVSVKVRSICWPSCPIRDQHDFIGVHQKVICVHE